MTRYQRMVREFERVIVTVLELLLIVTVAVSAVILIGILFYDLHARAWRIDSLEALQPELEQVFSGVLMVLLGLELMETLKTYFRDHHIRIEVILVVAMIAVGRHLIQLHFDKVNAITLIGLAILIVSLSIGYFLVCKAHVIHGLRGPEADSGGHAPE